MAGVNTPQKRRAAVGVHFRGMHFGSIPGTPPGKVNRRIIIWHYPFGTPVVPPPGHPGHAPMHHLKRRLCPIWRFRMYPLWRK